MAQLLHHDLADHARWHFALAEHAQAMADTLDCRLHRVAADRALLERLHDSAAQLALVEGLARAVVLHHLRHDELGGFERGEALAAGEAFAPAPDLVTLAGQARVRHLGVVVIAERTVHGRSLGERPALTRKPESARR